MIAYMFHAIGKLEDGDWADPHYSYSDEKFKLFLKSVKAVVSLHFAIKNELKKAVIVTFDDGHISNYYAAKYMYENKYGTADFFVNPDHIGKPYYMSWLQLKELQSWGMSIQSHGLDHQYLSDCDDQELVRQLKESKRLIEANMDQKVTILAPPGGRFDKRTSDVAMRLGYRCIANSKPGRVWGVSNFHIPRIAVLKNYSVEDLVAAKNPLSLLVVKLKIKYMILKIIKTLLGNKQYDKFRLKLVGEI
jgi:peptidoglycan/xylan/chitin deacetylase (PgdA/CDA1 family)